MMTRPGRENIIKLLALYLKAETNNKIIEMNSLYNHSFSTFNASSGILPRGIGLGAASVIDVTGVTSEAELKSVVG